MLGKNCDFGVYFFVTRSYQTCTRVLDSVPSTKKEKKVLKEKEEEMPSTVHTPII